MSRQVTLFDSWKTTKPAPERPSTSSEYFGGNRTSNCDYFSDKDTNQKSKTAFDNFFNDDDVIALMDDETNNEDKDLVAAIEASKAEFEREQQRRTVEDKEDNNFFKIPSTSIKPRRSDYFNSGYVQKSSTSRIPLEEFPCPGFDEEAGKIWIYPTNFPKRNYQFEIIEKALFYNTLVTLPTGLGKTFIAAVVMYNFYRWYPSGKVIFMAPTKPLVAQQVEACYNIMGIPQDDVAEMTGSILPARRTKLWKEKRVFFLTPQVINNDLQKDVFPAASVKCLVIDEAHKATGDHAYCQVVRELLKCTKDFRVLALSATPGSDLNAVQQVLSNVLIAHLELRSEESAEIKRYTHDRHTQCIVVPLSEELKTLRDKYEKILQNWLNQLSSRRVLFANSAQNCSLTCLLTARAQFRMNKTPSTPQWQVGMVENAFANAIGLLHGYYLLTNMGMKSLYNYFQGKVAADKSTAIRRELNKNSELNEIYQWLRERFMAEENDRDQRMQFPTEDESFFDRSHAAAAFSTQQVTNIAATSHPKLVRLVEILIDHFKAHGKNTRVMVFAQYRDCVEEITELLKKQRPLIRPMKFVGQTSSRTTAKGISQKEQLRVVSQFKAGGYNTLVSTSVGEEGLDIGEVDLIVCYDATASPVRSVQRMGRTGRKREGKIVVLVTEGKEQNVFNMSEFSKKRVHKAIVANKKFELYHHNRRMVPSGLVPVCRYMHMSQNKPYENALLRKRSSESAGTEPPVKRFIGTLTEQELIDWERNFKIDHVESIRALEERRPLKMLSEENTTQSTAVKSYLNEYYLWQDRAQSSFFVKPSSLRQTFVKLMGVRQFSVLEEDVAYEYESVPDIERLCDPRQPTPVVKNKTTIIRRKKMLCPHPKRRKLAAKKKPDKVGVVDSMYTTAGGDRLNLDELFPKPSIGRTELISCYEYSNIDGGFHLPHLRSVDVIEAIRSSIGK